MIRNLFISIFHHQFCKNDKRKSRFLSPNQGKSGEDFKKDSPCIRGECSNEKSPIKMELLTTQKLTAYEKTL